MANCNELNFCKSCDCVFEKAALTRHRSSLCSRCGSVAQGFNGLAIDQRLALQSRPRCRGSSQTSPTMTISLQGLKSSASLMGLGTGVKPTRLRSIPQRSDWTRLERGHCWGASLTEELRAALAQQLTCGFGTTGCAAFGFDPRPIGVDRRQLAAAVEPMRKKPVTHL